MEVVCFLCGTAGASSAVVDHGNRLSVSCTSTNCGRFVVTNRAIRRLAEGGPNKKVLVELVRQANARKRVLDISVATDGLVQTAELPSGE